MPQLKKLYKMETQEFKNRLKETIDNDAKRAKEIISYISLFSHSAFLHRIYSTISKGYRKNQVLKVSDKQLDVIINILSKNNELYCDVCDVFFN